MIPKRSQNDTKTISKRSHNHSKRNPPISQNGSNISWVSSEHDHSIRTSHWFKTSSRSLQSNFKNIWKQTSENGLTRPQYGGCKGWHQSKCLLPLWLLTPLPQHIFWDHLNTWLGVERGGDGRTYQESFHIMCQGQGLDSKGWRSWKKEVNNKEEKEESRKRGMIESEKREGEMTNKVVKQKPRRNVQKRAKRAFDIFFEGFPFSTFLATPSSFFQVWSSLSSLVLPFPVYCSRISFKIFSPCCPGPVP